MSKKKYYILAMSLFVIGIFVITNFYKKIYSNNVTKTGSLYINSKDNFQDLEEKITPFLKNTNSFFWLANIKKYCKLKAGRYLIKENMSNNDLINMLRSGNQTAIKISFNNQDTLEKFANRIAEQLEVDASSIINSFTEESFLEKNGFTKKSVLQICIPNSYNFYWTVTADKFRDRMLLEYHKFWTASRIEKAKSLNMTKNEVITLASIVQKETAKKSERPIVAGLYLNRLKKRWPLQADPTVIFALKERMGQDYVVKRVLHKDLQIKSPYNTYQNVGLPPSLIAMPDISSIEAVLNAKKHNYFYMCASIEKIGYHEFSKTLAQHNRNAAKYQRWISKLGVNR